MFCFVCRFQPTRTEYNRKSQIADRKEGIGDRQKPTTDYWITGHEQPVSDFRENCGLPMGKQAEDPDQDQVKGHNIVQEPRHDQDENACDQCDEWG
jgi:hypothetical protein